MGLIQQNEGQKYKSKKTFTGDGTTLTYVVSKVVETFNPAHQQIYNAIQAGGVNTSLINNYVKVYLDGDIYLQKIVDTASTPVNTIYVNRWNFYFTNADGWILEFDTSVLADIPSGVKIEIHIDQAIWNNPVTGITNITTNNYQVTSLEDIISNFMIVYVGEDKFISKVNRTDVQFHAMRALQELSFDTFKSCKSMELEVPPSLVLPLPNDYVNYVKLSWKDDSGIQRPIYPAQDTSNPKPYKQDADGNILFDVNGDGFSDTDTVLSDKDSDTWNTYKSSVPSESQDDYQDDTFWPHSGRRYGLESSHANTNGVYYIDCARHMINFSSNISGKTIILDYVSDSLGTDEEMVVHKMAEEAMYKWIMYGILSTRSNIPEYIVQRYKKERFAETRKAKLRLSNIKLEEITQVLRGKSKFIKH